MKRVRLVRLDPETEQKLESHRDYNGALESGDWGKLAEVVNEVVGETLRTRPDGDAELHWGGYVVADEDSLRIVGSCAFKSPPSGDGAVEIAYFTYPGHEGKGYASAMAARLIALGSSSPDVARIIAHTLPERSPSTRVLEKNGMTLTGEVIDPEDGRVWRWECAAGPQA